MLLPPGPMKTANSWFSGFVFCSARPVWVSHAWASSLRSLPPPNPQPPNPLPTRPHPTPPQPQPTPQTQPHPPTHPPTRSILQAGVLYKAESMDLALSVDLGGLGSAVGEGQPAVGFLGGHQVGAEV